MHRASLICGVGCFNERRLKRELRNGVGEKRRREWMVQTLSNTETAATVVGRIDSRDLLFTDRPCGWVAFDVEKHFILAEAPWHR